MEFVVLIAAFVIVMVLANYIKMLCYTHLTAYKRKKYSLIIVSVLYTVMIIYFILATIKYFNSGYFITYLNLGTTILFAAFTVYYIQNEIKKLKKLRQVL